MSEFKSTQYFKQISDGINGFSDAEKKDLQKKTNAVFEFHVKNKGG